VTQNKSSVTELDKFNGDEVMQQMFILAQAQAIIAGALVRSKTEKFKPIAIDLLDDYELICMAGVESVGFIAARAQ
jgi:hypothetical protein